MSKYQRQSYERDPRWSAIDEYAYKHLHDASKKPADVDLTNNLNNSAQNDLPDIAVSPMQGKFLMLQAQLLGAKNVIEIGLLGGYSTTWLASASPDIKVTSIELEQAYADVARENLEKAGLADRVEILVGSAHDILPQLLEEVNAGTRPKFSMGFIDADKESSWTYFDYIVKMSLPRSAIFIDNVVRKGSTADAEAAKSDSRVQGSRLAIETVGKDERVDACVIQTVGEKSYDGFLMAVVKEKATN